MIMQTQDINLNLTNRHKRDGKVYYFLNHNLGASLDRVSHDALDDLLNGGEDTINTQPGGHDGSDDERSVIIGDYALVLPTGTEIQDSIIAGNELPNGWQDEAFYWAAGLVMDDAGNAREERHERVVFSFTRGNSVHGLIDTQGIDTTGFNAFFQVLTAQRTISVILPADPLPMRTTTVEVATIDTDDSITDGSLTAELIAVTSPIEFDSTVSEVLIQHNNLVVTITGPGGASSVTVNENSSATLVINVTPMTDQPRDVNLSYTDIISGTTEMTTIRVPAGSTSQSFQVFVGDDDIAAQPTREFRVSLAQGDGYGRGDPSSVGINVLNDDVATVSISPVTDQVTEGDTIVLTITLDLATAQATSINLTLTHNGDFFSPAMNPLNLANPINPASINLNLTNRHQRNGKVYYYLDHSGDSNADPSDQITHDSLDRLFNGGVNTDDTQDDGHIGSDDARSVIIDGYALVLPTVQEMRTFFDNNGVPGGWHSTGPYWSATSAGTGQHSIVGLNSSGRLIINTPATDTANFHVFFQVLTAQRTISVILPAEQLPMGTVTVEVATIDTDDSITDGSLTAELMTVTSSIELGSTVTSEVEIQHNNSVVTITAPDGGSLISVDEGSDVDLVINVTPLLPANRALDVNLSYMDVISGTTEMRTITVPAGGMSQSFQVFVGDDDIAAQTTRISRVSLAPGGYVMGDLSSVGINVLNNDPALVSIFAVRDRVDEGTTALFTVQVSNEIAVSFTVTINLAITEGEFGISQTSADVVITAGETTALLTVMTIDDDIGEAYGSLTAAINSPLNLPESISGVQPEISATNSSATVTILDDDLSVRITTLDNKAITTISESDNVRLSLILSDDINRLLRVNLSSVGDSGLAMSVPSFVDVPANTTTHNFTVFVIDDTIIAQPERNIAISVAAGVGYTESADPVRIIVTDDDTAAVTISPVRTPITAGEDAEFEVILGLGLVETAVDVDIGINVKFGGNFIRNEDRGLTTVTVSAGQTSTLLIVQTMENTGREENSSLVATLRAVSHSALRIDDPSSARVEISALSPLSITATLVTFELMEGGASTELSVSLNRIESDREDVTVTVTIDSPAGSGLTVSSPLLTFRTTVAQTVTVAVPSDGRYTGNRDVTLTFAATDYAMATVTVNIIEDTPQPIIDLRVTPTATATLNLVRFTTSTEIEVSVAVDAMLNIQTEGAVTLADGTNSVNFNLIGGTSTRIGIFGNSIGDGEVEVTANGIGAGTGAEQKILTVSVMVSTPTLVISGVSPSTINLLTREATEFIVSVRAELGDVLLGATIDDKNVAEVILGTSNVEAGTTTATVTVTGLNVAGETTLTLTAENLDYYESASIEVPVNVSLRSIELSVEPSPLEVVIGTSEELTITATPTAMITIISDDDNIASVPGSAAAFMLMGGAENSTKITVSGGDNVNMTMLTIEASADGHTTEIATVSVEVQNRFRITATPPSVDLVADGASARIDVSVSRLIGGSVTVGIAATDGLSVPSSVTLTDLETVAVEVSALAGASGTATLTFTATDYATATVTVEIMDAPTQPDPPVGLVVAQRVLEIVTGESRQIGITVATTATITIMSDSTGIASVAESAERFELQVDVNESTQINVSGGNVGITTVTITAEADGYTSATASVRVEVVESLRIVATPPSVDLVADGASARIDVSVSRLIGDSVTVGIAATDGLSVPSSVTLTDLETVAVEVSALAGASGTATLTFTATDYATATVTVEIMDAPTQPDPPVGLVVAQRVLEIVTGESRQIGITVATTATITIMSDSTGIASVAESAERFELQVAVNESTQINVSGGNVGITTVTITAEADGYTSATASVRVEVVESLRIVATPPSVDLVADGASARIDVSVSRLIGGSVTVGIAATDGLSVPSSVTLTDLETVAVEVSALAGASGTATLTFTATDYATATVTVEIMDAPTQPDPPVGLVVAQRVLEIVTGESRQIGITVATTATITIMSDSTGIASVAESAERFELQVAVNNSTQINVSGGNVGITTVTITAEADGYTSATASVRVEVVESLRIVATPPSVDLVADGASARIDVSVSRLIGGSVTVGIAATDGLSVPSSVTLTDLETVAVEVSALAGASGTATLTFTATDYATATVTVEIMDAPTQPDPPVGLVVAQRVLEIVTGESRQIGITVATTATITIMSDSTGIASVAESAERFELQVDVNESTQINVSGGNVGITTVTITAEADGYTSATASVRVEVVESLRIVATPPSVDLVADGASARIDVSVSRLIGGSVTVGIAATDGLSVPSSVTLTDLETVAVEVSALAGASGTATLTFTATDYATATVTVEIMDAPTQPDPSVGLVVAQRVLEIVTGESRQIGITVATTATITIMSDSTGIASVAESAERFELQVAADNNSTQINVSGGNVGITTVTITAEADGYTSATASVRVEVVESLRIVATPPSVDLVADGASARIDVSVSRLIGGSVTVGIAATDGLSVPSSVTLTDLETVAVEVSALAGASGTATLTFTATDYATATVTVEIMDAPTQPDPPVGLVVAQRVLEIVTGESRQIGITVATTATITIMSDSTGIASVAESAERFELQVDVNESTQINVSGGNVGITTVTITAEADGYTSATASVRVEVVESLRIVATPPSVDLVADGASARIDVSVSRLIGGSVTVGIAATDGLSVPSSVTLTDLETVAVEVSALAGASGTATLTFTATDYATATVTVEIMDAPTQPDPSVGLVVAQRVLEIVTGESRQIGITVATTATITIMSDSTGIASVAESAERFELQVDVNESTQINVSGGNVGITTVTITAEADGYTSATASVRVEVVESLRIVATPPSVDLVADGASARIDVSVSRLIGGSVTVGIAATDGLSVPSSVTLTGLETVAVEVSALAGASGTATLTFTATDYATATVTVEIMDAPTQPDPSVGLVVAQRVLEIVTGESRQIGITVATTATITIMSDSTGIASVAESAERFELQVAADNNSTQINVSGGNVGITTVTITAEADGYTSATASVRVEVVESLRIVATPPSVDLVADGASARIDVSVSRLIGGSVTVGIAATDGLSVPSSVTLTDLETVAVEVSALAGASGTATLTFTATDYATATVTVEIMDALTQPDPPVGLVVAQRVLEIVTGESRQIGITVATTATITIMSDSTGIASVAESAERFELQVDVNESTQINVSGGNVGITTVTITAEADGYTSATASVRVEVVESLRIVATPPSVDLVADGASARIDVSVSRLIGGSVTVGIAATDGLSVPSSVTLTDLETVAVEVSALAGASGTATLTFTATDYATATVTVEIMDAPTQPDPPVGLVVAQRVLEIVTGESRQIGITVATTATITIMSDSTGIASVAESAERFELQVDVNESTQINVSGGNVGITTVTITAEADGYTSATASVRVEVVESLRIVATPPSVDLVADGASARIDVSVSRLIGGSVTVGIAATDGLSVPSSVTLTGLETVAVEVSALAGASGTATLTFTATDYATATVTVEIMDALTQPDPPVGLVVAQRVLEIVTGESRQIGITVATTATITIMSDSTGIASVAESAERFELQVDVNESTQINVSGGNVGITTVTITAEADGYTSATASVRVEVVESLRIVATPPSVDLVADGASARIDVSVSRLIGGSVTVGIAATDGLSVPSSVTLTGLETVAVEVSALAGASGTATLTFTATDYATATVTVEIMDAPTQPDPSVGLVVAQRVLEIVTGESRQIGITVATTATITIMSDSTGIASVAESAERFELQVDVNESTQINVSGGNVGITTVTITAEADGYTSATASVEVEVIESLRIEAEPISFDLVQGASTEIRVRVSRVVGDSVRVDIAATEGLMVASSVTLATRDEVAVAVTATESYSGIATVTFTTTAEGYESATVAVRVAPPPSLPAIGLVVVPPALEVVTGESTQLTITAGATTATITISAEGEAANISVVGSDMLNAANDEVVVAVRGVRSGITTLTVTAASTGYMTATTQVRVEVIESLRIAATPASVDLVAGASTEISVSVSRLVGESVTVDIVATDGLSVPSSVTLTGLETVAVEVSALAGASGTATLTFTATDYATATVTVRIAPPPSLPAIGLVVVPPALEVVTGESTNLTITAGATTATITISAEGEAANISVVGSDMLNAANDEVVVAVRGVRSGITTLTVTAASTGYMTATTQVRVEVIESLRIAATPASVDLVAGASTEISVSVSRLLGESVTVDIVATDGLSVASSVTLANLDKVAVAVTATESYSGMATVTFTATDYATATVTVRVAPPPSLPAIGLVVVPPVLEIITGESTNLTITAGATTATITISAEGEAANISVVGSDMLNAANDEVVVAVRGVRSGITTLTVTAASTGYMTATTQVRVEVVESLRIVATPASVDLVAGSSTQINVSVSRLVGESVTVDIVATTGLSVASSVLLTNLNEVVVSVTATESYAGTATVTFTTTAEGYESATVAVRVAPPPSLPAIGLVVVPPALEVVTGESTQLTITAGATTATITISAEGEAANISVVGSDMLNAANDEVVVAVRGVRSGITTLTVTAASTGYMTATTQVRVEVIESLRIAATPASVDLVAGASTEISVSVSRLVGESVTVDIVATTGLSVATSVTLANLDKVAVAVTATESYAGTATVTFTADDYATATVTVRIAPPPSLPAIGLVVVPPALEVVTGESTNLTITAGATTATITISAEGEAANISVVGSDMLNAANDEVVVAVRGVRSGITTLTVTAASTGYMTATTQVRVEVIESLRIAATPASVDLVAGASTEISVSVSRLLGESVTVDIVATDGLSVASSVTLANLDKVAVAVTATESYSGMATVTFTATDYATATVTVRVAPPPSLPAIGLVVVPPALEVVTGESTQLTITAGATTATITISAEGEAANISVVGSDMLNAANDEVVVAVRGVRSGITTLTVTAASTGYMTATTQVRVEVIESLRIAATPASVDLVAGASTEISVSVSRLVGESVTVDIVATTGLSVATSVTLANLDKVAVTVTATESYAGTATVTFTATDYATATVTVRVAPPPSLPAIGLVVVPPALEVVTGESTQLTITAGATTATITISAEGEAANISVVGSDMLNAANDEVVVAVRGVRSGITTLTVTAASTGYMTATTQVRVEVIESLRIAAMPASVDLVAGASAPINVSVSRLIGGSVTVDIDASAGLSVDASSVTLTNLGAIEVAVSADVGASGTGTLTFTATDYATATVTVRVAPPPSLPAIGLVVVPPVLEIITGESTNLTITAGATTATITISAEGEAANISVVGSDMLNAANDEVVVAVRGVRSGITTLTVTAASTGYMTATTQVRVEVIESLRIAATPASVDLVAGASTEISVSVSRLVGESVTVDIVATTGLSVATSVTLANLDKVAVTVTATESYAGTATVTFTATDYATATVTVRVAPPPSLPAIGLVVVPPALEVVTGESTNLTITAGATTATITISAEGEAANISVVGSDMLNAANDEVVVAVRGVRSGITTLTVTAASTGYMTATTQVRVEVIESLRIAATPASVDLVAGASTEISVSVSRLVGESVTVDIVATDGLSVATSVTLTDLEAVAVEVSALADASGTATLTFTADDYASTMVTVNITEDDPQPIGLVVTSSTELDLVRFASTEITVSVAVAATLNVVTEGSVRLEGKNMTDSVDLEAGETQIQIEAVSVGEGTVTFTVGGGETADTAVVTVMVSTPSLIITGVPTPINLLTREITELIVSVRAEAGEPKDVTLTATIDGTGVAEVRLGMSYVEAGTTTATVTVTGLTVAGNTTLTLTATHSDYETEIIKVPVNVSLQTIGLSVSPPSLRFEQEATRVLTIEVGASTEATIMISSDPSSIVSVLSQRFTLMGGPSNNSTMIEVSGVGIGRTTLTITAIADGYAIETATVIVEVQNRFRIAATPVSLSLVEGDSTGKEISVSLSRIPEGSGSVTVTINLQDGSGLTVMPSSLEFTGTETRTVTVEVLSDNLYIGDRNVMLTFTADDYTTATVTVEITDDDLQTIGLM